MAKQAIQDLAQVSYDLLLLLQEDPAALLAFAASEGEVAPQDIELLSYSLSTKETLTPARGTSVTPSVLNPPGRPLQSGIGESKNSAITRLAMVSSRNFKCDMCSYRLYPVHNFLRLKKNVSTRDAPATLILHYNGPLVSQPRSGHAPSFRDNSSNYIFGSKEADQIFTHVLSGFDCHLDDFYYQEYLACYFNPDRSTEADWEARALACQSQVEQTIQEHRIERLIVCASAAIVHLGKEKALGYLKQAESCLLSFGKIKDLPALIVCSPQSLAALARRRIESIEIEERQRWLEKEREIKEHMHKALALFLSK